MNDPKPAPEAPRLYAEDEDGSTVILQLRRNRTYGQRFLTMFTTAAHQLSEMDRPPVYFRTLMFLLTALDPIQFRRLSAREVVEATGISLASADRALGQLEADKVIFCQGKTGAKARRLNRNLAWMSSAEKFAASEGDPMIVDARGR